MNILIVTGSISQQSNNKKIARWFENNYKDKVDLVQFPLATIPMYNMDIENDPPQEILDMRKLFHEADGVIMITPEYNGFIPGVLKNMLDWASRGDLVLKDKWVFMLGGSTGRFGTLRAQIGLKQVLESVGVGAKVFGRQLQIDTVHKKFDDEGNSLDERTEGYLKRAMDEFIDLLA